MSKDWKTEFTLHHCKGTENPRLFDYRQVRTGGHSGYHDSMATFKESELIELRDLIDSTLKQTKRTL